ncbi:thiamine phosphate synthase [Trinickia dinghuensis]|uniref:Thiamine-phosphate synthase n=1 Tax=Trinickia dinghuensis TaxID=2291023 RepID=A0A3D8JQZ1_9BURK|nr:thiamine phosphate synthase [Trinickia dinghuensis]RDU95529.1 thiamine phosphate synthase [Trinickia dinghuensis]
METLKLSGRDFFWPPADELTEAAERIRARLGDWPRADRDWRICLAAPDTAGNDDLIVVIGRAAEPDDAAAWRAAGAGLVEARTDGATLTTAAGERFVLEGTLAEDWLAALAAFLDCGFEPHDALVLALAWRDGDEAHGADAWPIDLSRFPRIAGLPAAPAQPFPVCPPRLGLYPVMPSAQWVERLLALGVETVQLRLKDATPAQLEDEIAQAVAAGRRHGAHVFVNDHWREAAQAGAYGVHLGQEDLETADLAAIAQSGMRLGLSTHGYFEMLRALHFRPSYLAFGAVFPTGTKTVATAPQGLARLERYVRLLGAHVPLVAIGGIDLARLPAVLATGVGSAALVSAITAASDLGEAVERLQQAFIA